MILIISFADDPHALLVAKALDDLACHNYTIVDLERALSDFSTVVSEFDFRITSKHSGTVVRRSEIEAIWWRRAGQSPPPRAQTTEDAIDFAEGYWGLRWAIESLPSEFFPFGHPAVHTRASNKILQLHTARAVGFRIPATCISNSTRALTEFATSHERLVVKPLHTTVALASNGEELGFCSAAVERDVLLRALDDAPTTSLFCQERVRKTHDVRVLALPDGSQFAVAIDNAALGSDEVDWRPTVRQHKHTVTTVPPQIADLIRAYMARLGLTSGSFDFGVTRDNEWVFFECNPNGQWLWLELQTRLLLARHVADILVRHCKK